MLKTVDLIKNMEEKYIPMLESVDIPDFTKCIAEFSGLGIKEVCDDRIKEYLQTWARNKYKFFELLGGKTKNDRVISYKKIRENLKTEIMSLAKDFPIYALWLAMFEEQRTNKIEARDIGYRDREIINKVFGGQFKLDGSTMTHFFKSKISAPDELVTKIAHIFENDMVEANYTISIDPVDIMTASENPYDWQSCYRLESCNSESHADGCMAALLDNASLITYVWKNEGKLDLYGKYELKNVRYKMMREWIAVSEKMTTVHFNDIYPGRNYDKSFYKILRNEVETLISNFKQIENRWKEILDDEVRTERDNYYGYSEFSHSMYVQSNSKAEDIVVYDVRYQCACGCSEYVNPSHCDDDDYSEYNGSGFRCGCFSERYWCDDADDWCDEDECDRDCDNCRWYIRQNPHCDLDDTEECDNIPSEYWDDANGVVRSCSENCEGCALWDAHHISEENNDEDE